MLDLETWASGSILIGGNILLLFILFSHSKDSDADTLALLPTLFNYEKTRLELFVMSPILSDLAILYRFGL